MILKIYAVYIINIKKDGQELVFVYVQLKEKMTVFGPDVHLGRHCQRPEISKKCKTIQLNIQIVCNKVV